PAPAASAAPTMTGRTQPGRLLETPCTFPDEIDTLGAVPRGRARADGLVAGVGVCAETAVPGSCVGATPVLTPTPRRTSGLDSVDAIDESTAPSGIPSTREMAIALSRSLLVAKG